MSQTILPAVRIICASICRFLMMFNRRASMHS